MKVLVIAAHPDDEILGVGGTICKYIANKDNVFICIVTKAYETEWTKEYIEQKVHEQKLIDDFLKITKRYNLNLPTVKLNTIPTGKLCKEINNVIEKVKPNVVFTHFDDDLNEDHSIIFNATMVATRPPKKIQILCYEVLSSTDWSTITFNPNIYVDIKDFINNKLKAFSFYKSEAKDYPHPRSEEGIKNLAKYRGNQVCLEFAEAFKLIRDIWV